MVWAGLCHALCNWAISLPCPGHCIHSELWSTCSLVYYGLCLHLLIDFLSKWHLKCIAEYANLIWNQLCCIYPLYSAVQFLLCFLWPEMRSLYRLIWQVTLAGQLYDLESVSSWISTDFFQDLWGKSILILWWILQSEIAQWKGAPPVALKLHERGMVSEKKPCNSSGNANATAAAVLQERAMLSIPKRKRRCASIFYTSREMQA